MASLLQNKDDEDKRGWARRILDNPKKFPRIAVDYAREVLPRYNPDAELALRVSHQDHAMAAANDMVEF